MGRKGKQVVAFPFKGKSVKFYRPTDGQGAMMHLAASDKSDSGRGVVLFFDVIQALTVNRADWEYVENKFVAGEATVEDICKVVEQIFSHEWPEETPDDGSAQSE
jgi:hypothetical protein